MALGRAIGDLWATDLKMGTDVIDMMQLGRIEVITARPVRDYGVILPTVPQFAADFDKFGRDRMAVTSTWRMFTAVIESFCISRRGGGIPSGTTTAHKIERG